MDKMTTNIVVDDGRTNADRWKDWCITNLQQSEFKEINLEYIDGMVDTINTRGNDED